MTSSIKFYKHPKSLVESKNIGNGTRIWAFAHILKGAKIGRHCNIGDHSFVESTCELGNRVTIKNGVSVWDGVVLGDDVFVGPNVAFTNDLWPISRNKRFKLQPTIVGKGVSIGANATILCGIRIGRYAMIGAGAVLTKDVPDFGLVYGNPAEFKAFICSCRVKLKFFRKKAKCRCGLNYKLLSKNAITLV